MPGNTPNSWEDAAGDDNDLARQAQDQLNLNRQQQQQGSNFRPSHNAPTFQPGAASFTPGAPVFAPGTGSYGQAGYGAGYGQQFPQYGQYNQYGMQGGYEQYGQPYGNYGGGYGQQAAYGQQPGQFAGYQQQQQQQQQQPYRPPHVHRQQQQQAVPQIAKKQDSAPASGASTPAPSKSGTSTPTTATPAAAPKVLKIGGDAVPKVLKIGGDPAPPPKKEPGNKPGPGASIAANKAVAASTAGGSGKTSPSPSGPLTGKSSPAPTSAEKAALLAAERREADAVEKEQEDEVDDSVIEELYGKVGFDSRDIPYSSSDPTKEHVNLVFIGHVDAGKSSLGGAILYATGMVDERTMEKYKRDAKEQGRESWYLSWALDLTKEERSKGKTVEVGRAYFETEKRRYTILDAPGHKNYVPNMIGGASQADVGILVISARKGEYETGFEKGGQTREHAVLAKTQGVNKLIVVVNKMDDPTVEWSKGRYDECTTKLTQYLKQTGYNPKTG